MIINNFDLIWPQVAPDETHTILLVDPDAALASTIPGERFEMIARRYAEFIQRDNGVQLIQFPRCYSP